MKQFVQILMALLFSNLFMIKGALANDHKDHDHSKNPLAPALAFIENKGQWNQQAKFKIALPNGNMFVTENGFMYDFQSGEDQFKVHEAKEKDRESLKIRGHAYRVKFLNANTATSFSPQDKRPEYSNYFIGNDDSKWASNVGHYNTIVQQDLYKGVNLKIYNIDKQIKYDLIVKPNINTNQIAFSFEGVSPVLMKDGSLKIKTTVNEIIEEAPYTYQIINGKKVTVASKYKLNNGIVSFEFPNGYNKNHELIIDPNLIFASYSGGSNTSYYAHSATYDAGGNSYITALASGNTTGWPVTTGAYQTTASGSYAVTISKINPSGSALVYATYFAPTSGIAHPNALRVTANNELVMVGTITSNTLPVTPGAYQSSISGGNDLYITKFNSTGTGLVASTYLGGSGNDGSIVGGTTYSGTLYGTADNAINPTEVAFDQSGNIWITSNSASNNYPVTGNPFQTTLAGSYDVVLSKLNASLTNLLYSTYIGGSGWDGGIGMEYNKTLNEIVVTGYTASSNFPTTSGVHQATLGGGIDAFVFKINSQTHAMGPITYLGTTATDCGMRVAFDCGNNVYIAGTTLGNFPVTTTTAQGLVANGNIFLAKLNPTLSTIVASTRTGANATSYTKILPQSMMVDNCGNILITSMAENMAQNNLPLTADAFQTAPRSLYFAAFGPNFSSLEFGTYYGSPSPTSEHFHPGVSRMDPQGVVYVVKCTSISTYPTTPASYSPNKQNGSNLDIIFFKFDFEAIGLNASAQSGYAGYGTMPHAVRGCKSAFINYSRNGDTTVPMILRFNIVTGAPNLATNGVDYQQISDSLVFNAFERNKSLEIKPLLVPNMPTGPKMVVIESLNPCGCDGAIGDPIRRDTVFILDSIRAEIDQPLPAYCPGTQISITATVDPDLSFTWSPSQYNNGSLTINPTLTTTRDYVITVKQPGAPSTCPPNVKTFRAYVEQFPIISSPTDTIVCITDSIPIPVSIYPDSISYNYLWTPSTGLRANNIGTNFFKQPPGVYNYNLSVSTPIANCTRDKNIKITVVLPEKFTSVTPQSGTEIDYNEYVNLKANGNFLFYTWYPTELFVDPFLSNNTSKVLANTLYQVVGVDRYGCKDTADVLIKVNYPNGPYIPNAFSPNGDGLNDEFLIPGNQFNKILKFEIYNRYGALIFNTIDPKVGWNGTYKGKPADQGVYMYIFTAEMPDKSIKTFKGDITLIR